MKQGVLKLYIGMPQGDVKEFLYLDISIPNREVPLWRSKDELNGSSGEDFLKTLEIALNEASLWVNTLGIQLKIDTESIKEMADDFSEREEKEIKKLLKEIKE
jgi:hypothetical protein